jgi:putative ubiquitin-RnfH superfamily antitoxin RatB of RatAB toxin-antitoxin module
MESTKTVQVKASKSTLDKIEEGMKLVKADLMAYKKSKNSDLVVLKGDKIVYLKPE